MALIVQKFGGTSVADPKKMKNVARRVGRTKDEGNDVIVVVSAPGKTTDQLVELARRVSPEPSGREYDMLLSSGEQISIALLAMALHELGYEAISFTGPQLGIRTDTSHSRARILSIDTDRLREELAAGKVVVVAGFQGISIEGEITTLGRGGSDTTAVALAAVAEADLCEIYTDVEGVYTADPRVVPLARRLDRISYDEMLELAGTGAKVLHLRSVEFAKKYHVPLRVRSSFTEQPGTLVTEEVPEMENVVVSGIALDDKIARVSLLGVPDVPGIAATIFRALAHEEINVDMIAQSVGSDGLNTVSFTVPKADLKRTLDALADPEKQIHAAKVESDANVAMISAVGVGMKSHSGVAAEMFGALADAGINILMISTSEIKISCIIDSKSSKKAMQVIHGTFGLDK